MKKIPMVLFVLMACERQAPKPIQSGINTTLPAPKPPPPLSKLEFFKNAEVDSTRYVEEKVTKSIEKIQLAMKTPTIETPRVTGPPPMIPVREDPELKQLDTLLDKVIKIQHPEQKEKVQVQADDQMDPVEAITESEGTLTSGEVIALRLEDTLKTKKDTIPAGTRIIGTVTLQNERLRIQINSILDEGKPIKIRMEAFDLDGQPGLYVPGSLERDVSKESAQQALDALSLETYDPSIGAQATSATIGALKTLLTRKVRQVKVTVRAGYRVILK